MATNKTLVRSNNGVMVDFDALGAASARPSRPRKGHVLEPKAAVAPQRPVLTGFIPADPAPDEEPGPKKKKPADVSPL